MSNTKTKGENYFIAKNGLAIYELILKYPNDAELGNQVRELYLNAKDYINKRQK